MGSEKVRTVLLIILVQGVIVDAQTIIAPTTTTAAPTTTTAAPTTTTAAPTTTTAAPTTTTAAPTTTTAAPTTTTTTAPPTTTNAPATASVYEVQGTLKFEPYVDAYGDINSVEHKNLKVKVERNCKEKLDEIYQVSGSTCSANRFRSSAQQVIVRVSATDVDLTITFPRSVPISDLPSNNNLAQSLERGNSTFGNLVVTSSPVANPTTPAPTTTTTTMTTTASSGATVKISFVNTFFFMFLTYLLSCLLNLA
ncbi:hypothetical protein NL108_005404 [Boleophthalmus pectinirostris]|nr:hypothetical protein NL108_005404 [Boleophthalmus pectinirostris]